MTTIEVALGHLLGDADFTGSSHPRSLHNRYRLTHPVRAAAGECRAPRPNPSARARRVVPAHSALPAGSTMRPLAFVIALLLAAGAGLVAQPPADPGPAPCPANAVVRW